MATYNTAFGTLPGIETLTGTRRPQQDEEEPRDFMQQYRAQQQTKPAEAPAPAQTFAQMQAAGQARPAPPMFAPAPAPAPTPAPSGMMQQLREQLAPTAAPAAAAPVAAPAAEVPPMLAQLSSTMGYSPTGGITGQPTIDEKTRTATFTNVEVPVANAPQYTGATPPATAPNGSTYKDTSGTVWTKRAGIWVVEAQPGQTMPTGYAGLTPIDLQQQTVANLPQGYASKSNAFEFMRQYGIPNTPQEKALLASQSGMTVADIDRIIQQDGGRNLFSQEYMRQLRQTGVTGGSVVGGGGGGPSGGGGGVVGGGGGEKWEQITKPIGEVPSIPPRTTPSLPPSAPPPAFGQTPPTLAPTPMPSFAPMPAIPSLPPVPLPDYGQLTAPRTPMERYTGSEQAMELRRRLAEQLDLIGKGPPEIQGQAYEAARQAKLADLTAQFGAQRSQLEEELAARGLSASTIGAGRYGDVAGQQARAIAGLEAELLQQQAEAEARNRQLYLTSMGQLAGMVGEQDLGAFEANLKARQMENDINFRAAELQQDAALKGRELTLQQARDQAQMEYQRGQLGLGYAEMGSRERMQTQQQTFEAGQSALERQLRETMQIRQLTSEEKRTLDQLTLQREQLAEEKRRNVAAETFRDREFEEQKRATGVLEAMRQGELTLSQGTRLISIISQIYNGELPIEAWDTMLRSIGLDPAKWASYKPAAKTPPTPPPTDPKVGPGADNPPVTVGQVPPPTELSQYSNGQRFVINGVTYYLQNGKLVDGYGRQYAGSSE